MTSETRVEAAGDETLRAGALVWAVGVLAVGCLALGLPTSAEAQEKSKTERAQEHFDKGASLYLSGKHAQAIVEFRKAYRLRPHPVFLYNIARTHVKMGQCEKGRETLGRIDKPDRLGNENRAKMSSLWVGCDRRERARSIAGNLAVARREATEKEKKEREATEQETDEDVQKDEKTAEKDEKTSEETGATETASKGTREQEGSQEGDTTAETDEGAASGSSSTFPSYVSWAMVGTGAALIGGGVISDAATVGRFDTIEEVDQASRDRRPPPDELRAYDDRASGARLRTGLLFGSGALMVAGGLTTYFLMGPGSSGKVEGEEEEASGEAQAKVRVTPTLETPIRLDISW